jgi:glycosyltransferase involved in cell wall biosynthesis
MVIAHVVSSFQIGGQEVMVVELATRQHARGHRVIAVTLERGKPGPLQAAFARAGIETAHVPKLGSRVDITLPVRLAFLFRRHDVQVAHLHNHLPLIYGTPAGKMNRCIVVATRHGQDEGSKRQIWLRRHIARGVDSYVAVSNEVAKNTRAHSLAVEPKLTVIENGIDLGCYEHRASARLEVRTELGLTEGDRVIGTVCRLVDCKNLGLLLRSCMPHLGPVTRLVVVGDGPERSALVSLAAQYPQGRFVRFLGQRTDVARLLNAFDLFALSSRTEGHPISVIEAMATGLPVLATKVGGIPEMVEDGTTGFLAEVEESAFASRLAQALDQYDNWSVMGRAARTAAHERFSSETMADRYQALYESIMKRHRVS